MERDLSQSSWRKRFSRIRHGQFTTPEPKHLCSQCAESYSEQGLQSWFNSKTPGVAPENSLLRWKVRHYPQSCLMCNFFQQAIGMTKEKLLHDLSNVQQLAYMVPLRSYAQPRHGENHISFFTNGEVVEDSQSAPEVYQHPGSKDCLYCRFKGSKIDEQSFKNHGVWRGGSEAEATILLEYHGYSPQNTPRVVEVFQNMESPWPSIRLETYGWNVMAQFETPTNDFRRIFQQGLDQNCFIPYAPTEFGCGRPIGPVLNTNLVTYWLETCSQKHGVDCSLDQLGQYPSSLNLIDVKLWSIFSVPGGANPRYLALSYVWGGVNQPQLRRAVFKSWQVDGALKRIALPATIVDAIILAQRIQVRYLWVDSLCIVQDDDILRNGQISQMFQIYQCAVMTIVAANSGNCLGGLPGISPSDVRVESWQKHDLPSLALAKVLREPGEILQNASWRTRGWTFQEELCSARALVFLPSMVFFSCTRAAWREDICLETRDMDRPTYGLNSIHSMLSRTELNRSEIISMFRGLVNHYLRRNLTKLGDVEDAFRGIAGILEPLLGPLYHGIPEYIFGEVIEGCWFWDYLFERRAKFPSWSWVGWVVPQGESDIGIDSLNPSSIPLLKFFRFDGDFHPLFEAVKTQETFAHQHFLPDEEEMMQTTLPTKISHSPPSILAFFTSHAVLEIQPFPGSSIGSIREYRVLHSRTRQKIATVRLEEAYVRSQKNKHSFIVTSRGQNEKDFHLMLIRWENDIAYKISVTAPTRPVKEHDWWSLEPEKKLIYMD